MNSMFISVDEIYHTEKLLFMGCALGFVCDNGISLNNEQLSEMLDITNAAASIVTGRRGALKVMPQKYEIDELRNYTVR